MKFRAACLRGIFAIGIVVFLAGCSPSGSGPLDEEKEPHYIDGKDRIGTLDYEGAIQSFDKALLVNPNSASAHFELAWLYDSKEPDPAAAIYHYQHFLQLQPHADKAEIAKQRILVCKQALAQSVSLGPVTEKVQRQFELASEENKKLTEENKRLHDELDKWIAYAARIQSLTNSVSQNRESVVRASPNTAPVQILTSNAGPRASRSDLNPVSSSNSTSPFRTHTVKVGDTLSLIARRYGVKLDALMAANPSLDARRLKVGQVIRVPGS